MQAQIEGDRTICTRLTDFILTYPAKMNDFCIGLCYGGTLLHERGLHLDAPSRVLQRRSDAWVLEGCLGVGADNSEYSFTYLPDVLKPGLYNLTMLYPMEFNFVPERAYR